ncbi:MAG: hypothetical protein JNN25_14200, partial [Candidatus Kapabacteria bacterium]|nr:hypothetical protein [Candidatus Kapabacteria bacterium]
QYRADTLRFPTAGRYVLAVDTTYSGALQTIGQNHFTVLTRGAVRVELAGLLASITAGQSQTFTASYFDVQNNPTDVGIRPVIVTGTFYRDTLTMTRRVTGVYEAETIVYPTTGTFTVTPIGIITANITGDRIFSVTQTTLASVQVSGLDTLLNAGERMPYVTLRFRDALGNLADPAAVVVNYTTTDASVTGAFTVTQLSVGTYRTDTLSFFQAGEYRLSVDTTYTGMLVVSGYTNFSVLSRAPVRVELTGLQPTLQAGDTLPAFSVKFFDTQNNPTDVGIRPVVVTATVNGVAYRDTLTITRQQTGVYQTTAKTYPGAALYTVTPLGIIAANITGDRTFTVTPRPAASVLFTGVLPALISGGLQARFRATLRDTYNNLTDNVQQDSTTIVQLAQVYVSMSTDATVSDSTRQANASLFTMQRTSLGVFLADAHPAFTEAGNYALGVQGIPSTSGTAAFTIRPNVDYRIVFENVPDTLIAGDSLRNVVVRYFDRNDNPTDNSLGRVLYARTGGSSTASVALTRLETGVYAVNSTQATLAGTYNLSVSGISSLFMEGNRTFVMRGASPTTVEFTVSTTPMTTRGSNVTLTLKYFDTFHNPTDWQSTVSAVNDELASTATFTLTRIAAGTYKSTQTIVQPGSYDLTLDAPPPSIEIIGTNNFGCSPGKPVRVRFSNVPGAVVAGEPLTGAFMTFYDVRGRTTNNFSGIITLSTRGAEAIEPVPFTQRDPIIEQHSGIFDIEPIAFTVLGTDTLRVDSDVDYRLPATGNYRFAVTPGTAVNANVQTIPENAAVSAGTPITVQIRYTDAFGHPTNCTEKATFVTTATTVMATPTRTIVNGVPVYTTTLRFNTVATYSVNIANVAINGTTNIIIYDGITRNAAFQNITAELTVGESQFFTVILRDAYGNLATSAPQLNFSNGSTSTGTISLIRLPNGYWSAQSLPFTVTGNYTLSFSTPPSVTMTGVRTFRVFGNPLPELRNLSPFEVTLNTSATLIASGDFFVQGATAVINNVSIPTIFRSPTQLEIQLPQSFTATLGSMILNIRNPLPGGGTSLAGISVTVVNPVPVLLALRPATIVRDCSQPTVLAMVDKFTAAQLTQAHSVGAKPLASQEPILVAGLETVTREITLYPVAPNPFSERTALRYALSEEASVTLEILDARSQRVATIVQERQPTGIYTTEWKPDGALASGTYYVRLTATTNAGKRVQRQQTITFIK